MKDRETRSQFEESLTALIKKHNNNTDIYNNIIEELKEKMTKSEIMRIWSGNKPLMMVSDMDLLLFSQAFYENIKETKEAKSINPKNIFTDNDFDEALHIIVSTNIKKDSITFHNVTRSYQKKIGCIYHIPEVTCSELSVMSSNNLSHYNILAQREATVKELFGEEIRIPKIFPEKVDAIVERILEGSYYPVDTIVMNVLKTGLERVEFTPTFDENIGDLTIYRVEGSTTDIIDGANRSQAAVKADAIAKEKNINIEVKFKMDIINVPLKNSHDCILQINMQTPLENDRIKALEPSKFMTIASSINIYENEELNILYQRLGESLKEYKDLNRISTIQIFSEGLEDHYKDLLDKNNPSIYRDVLEYQVSFFNEFFSIYFDNLQDVEKTKKESILFDINMFYSYIYISRTLYNLYNDNEKEWRKAVKKVGKAFDFNKSNTDWKNLKTTGKLTPKSKEQLISYLNNKLSEIAEKDEVALALS